MSMPQRQPDAGSDALQMELEAVREERDLYRSLLLAEPTALSNYLTHAQEACDEIRASLRQPARDPAAFRTKISQLAERVNALTLVTELMHLPTVDGRLAGCTAVLRDLQTRSKATGNDLLPAMVLLEGLCSHIAIAADICGVSVAARAMGPQATPLPEESEPRLAYALRQLAESTAEACGKRISLSVSGLERVPAEWISGVFDALGQLLRNAIEHGLESPTERVAAGKSAAGELLVELSGDPAVGFELRLQDDGRGLDTAALAQAAVRRGLLTTEAAATLDSRRLASLIFQPGLSTAGEGRGSGLSIVRDQMQRLGGRVLVASKTGQFTRYRIRLPKLDTQMT
jgi:signal transduction histidine kinase